MEKLADMVKPTVGNIIEECDLQYNDGHSRHVYVTDQHLQLSETTMIFSRTDVHGFITQTNEAFIEASGWERDELIGKPQYILRHPHMPASLFRDLWQTVKAGNRWTGCVKNLRKDGGYYWVRAVVQPYIQDDKLMGYSSVRRRIERSEIEECEALYRKMRQEEGR